MMFGCKKFHAFVAFLMFMLFIDLYFEKRIKKSIENQDLFVEQVLLYNDDNVENEVNSKVQNAVLSDEQEGGIHNGSKIIVEERWEEQEEGIHNASKVENGGLLEEKVRDESSLVLEEGDKFYSNTTLPDVLLAGVQKGGTTSLAQWMLGNHTEGVGLCGPTPLGDESQSHRKEVHFFDQMDIYNKGTDFYLQHYEKCIKKKRMSMDACPDYMLWNYARRIYDTYKAVGEERHVKIIFMLRDPIARQFSMYNHYLSHDKIPRKENVTDSPPLGFGEWMKSEGQDKKFRVKQNYGTYDIHLRTWFELFPRQNILILSYDELKNERAQIQTRVRQFLQVGKYLPGQTYQSNALPGSHKSRVPSCKAKKMLEERYAPHIEAFHELLKEYPSGPIMEMKPFPKFESIECDDDDDDGLDVSIL